MHKRNTSEMTITFQDYNRACECTSDDDECNCWDVTIPAKYEVCDTCNGRGSRVNPNIDGNGISAEEFDDDPDFRDDYFSGVYDVMCSDCDGLRVVLVADEDRMTEDQKSAYEAHCRSEAEYARERYYAMKYGY